MTKWGILEILRFKNCQNRWILYGIACYYGKNCLNLMTSDNPGLCSQWRSCEFFFLGGHKKNEKCGRRPYICEFHTEWRWEVLKVVTCSWIQLFLNNRSSADFCGWKGHKIDAFLWTSQARNQEFFRAGEFSRNQGTSINISSTTHERKAPQGKNMSFFLLETLKTTFKIRNLTQDGNNQGIFFQN